MQKLLRRVRGAIGMGLTWALAWGGAGVVMAVITGFTADVPFPLFFALLGFIAGVIFSAVLALTAGRRSFDQMSLPRFATWGAVGGIVMSAFFARAASLEWGDLLMVGATFAIASALCATGSLALARRATRGELPDVRHDSAELEVTDHETRQLR
ncbi:MAG TPA: hypothetical protein VFY85_01155 [Gemmatimonadaceae bacterium]|nr:hypothetical protein [Gemmatimonadaceae bacterium]